MLLFFQQLKIKKMTLSGAALGFLAEVFLYREVSFFALKMKLNQRALPWEPRSGTGAGTSMGEALFF